MRLTEFILIGDIGTVFGMHHQLGGSTEDDMNKMSVIGHFFHICMTWMWDAV